MRALALVVTVVVGLAPACPQRTLEDGRCQANTDCPQFNFCDPSGVCRCNDDAACDATEFCNLAGSCQQKLECFTDEDCRGDDGNLSAICDTRKPIDAVGAGDNFLSPTGGQCVTLNSSTLQCLMDSQCPFGFFCNAGICQVGCRDNGDCALGDPCINGRCDPTPGACNENGYCAFGESCRDNFCEAHPDKDILCARCKGDDALDNTCGSGACLIDPTVPGNLCTTDAQCSEGYCVKFPCLSDGDCPSGETCEGGGLFGGNCSGHCGDFFCGNDSCDDATDPCPRGYSCFQVIGVSNNLCTKNGGECAAGATCSADRAGENNENGSCSCLSDGDCPIGLTCSNPGPNGACIQGSTCAPQDGLVCEDLR